MNLSAVGPHYHYYIFGYKHCIPALIHWSFCRCLFDFVYVCVLLDKNESDAMGRTPLHTATEHGHEAVVKYLLAQGADKDKADLVGYTPLQSAAQYHQDALKGATFLTSPSFLLSLYFFVLHF